ncbi:hypothetical protein [Donghicola mangrovi]|uniref:Peptidase C-terminal archaeal/bacterial domain-containing protein n=1 Tax=Donghicola mangrovi TaxID=2729614 RepID=A0A850QED4_9RHOB|nr:hypothetical protein [Donghicola mangrovi]NVO24775.1 hypothetical protein [Donghicola mangrovi]
MAGRGQQLQLCGARSGQRSLEDPKIRIRTPDGVHLSDWDNDNSPQTDDGLDARITGFTASTTGYYYVTAYANGSGVGTYQISAVASTPSTTANSGSTTTTDISTDFDDAALLTVNGGAFASAIDALSDTDYFALNLEAGKTYEILVEATAQGNVDPYIYFFNPVLGLIAQNDDGGEGQVRSSPTLRPSRAPITCALMIMPQGQAAIRSPFRPQRRSLSPHRRAGMTAFSAATAVI